MFILPSSVGSFSMSYRSGSDGKGRADTHEFKVSHAVRVVPGPSDMLCSCSQYAQVQCLGQIFAD